MYSILRIAHIWPTQYFPPWNILPTWYHRIPPPASHIAARLHNISRLTSYQLPYTWVLSFLAKHFTNCSRDDHIKEPAPSSNYRIGVQKIFTLGGWVTSQALHISWHHCSPPSLTHSHTLIHSEACFANFFIVFRFLLLPAQLNYKINMNIK